MSPEEQLVHAVQTNDFDSAARVLGHFPELKPKLNDTLPGLPFDATILQPAVRWQSREMVSLLVLSGADINTKTHWWAGGFGVLDFAEPDFVPFLLAQGATMTPNAAARLGLLDELERLVRADPAAVHARGGDGQTPLHVAATVEIARFLLDHGAEIDALDVDHESTPAQYRVRDHTEVSRFLASRGAKTDILLASALGDLPAVRGFLDADPASVGISVNEENFPMRNPRAGGHIYIWTLGKYKTAHGVARDFGHKELFNLLMSRTPAPLAFALACELGDEAIVRTLRTDHPNIAAALSEADQRRVAYAALDNNTTAVRLMLEGGWPVDVRGQHGGTALHWAAFHGNAAMTREILRYAPNVEAVDVDHDGTPLGWALYGSVNGWHSKTGDYTGTVEALLDAGAVPPAPGEFVATDAVRRVLRARGLKA